MKLPINPENWTGIHADLLIARAWREYGRYERRIDFSLPQVEQDTIYEPYRQAREIAVLVARYTRWRTRETEMLP